MDRSRNGSPIKAKYEAPKLVVYGNLAEVTKGSQTGQYTDQAFPAGTAFSQLTFS